MLFDRYLSQELFSTHLLMKHIKWKRVFEKNINDIIYHISPAGKYKVYSMSKLSH